MTTNTNVPVPVPSTDRAEVSRIFAMVKHELSEVLHDANRKRPFYAPTVRDAQAKAKAAQKALDDFAAKVNAIKMNP